MSDDSRFKKDQREAKELVTLKGVAINTEGKLTKSNYFNFIRQDLDDYSDIQFTPAQAHRIATHLQKMSTGATAMVPMYCGGDLCPFKERCPLYAEGLAPVGRQCHRPDDKILTTNGFIAIKDLDPEKDSLVGYHRKYNSILRSKQKDGFKFKKGSRYYNGLMHNISTARGEVNLTSNHICIARFNEKALNKFCVYLMKKGPYFRIGKSRIVGYSCNKYHIPFAHRGAQEQADAMWILGLYDTNTEALLAEEYFSIDFQTSKACFVESFQQIQKEQTRYGVHSGLYRWATTEQYMEHHNRFLKPMCYYAEKLQNLGLDINYPIWENDNNNKTIDDVKIFARQTMQIRACNLLPEVMDIPVMPENLTAVKRGIRQHYPAQWSSFSRSDFRYEGEVYSLDVEIYNTYISNNIVLHNCLLEVQMVKEFIIRSIEEYDVDPSNFTEIGFVNELAEIEILLMRLNMSLARPENAELVIDQTISIGQDGTPIVQKQLSPFMEQKEKLYNRRAKIIKLMVGDRQEQYKKQAALKTKDVDDPSSKMAAMRQNLEMLHRNLQEASNLITKDVEEEVLTPEQLMELED